VACLTVVMRPVHTLQERIPFARGAITVRIQTRIRLGPSELVYSAHATRWAS
jgi:hypothetical protein